MTGISERHGFAHSHSIEAVVPDPGDDRIPNPITGTLSLHPVCEQGERQVKRLRIVTERDADVLHPGVLQASRQLRDPEVHLRIKLLSRLAGVPEAQRAREASVLDHVPPLKGLSGKLIVQMLIVQDTSFCLVRAQTGLGLVFAVGSPLGREELRWDSGMRGKVGSPCSPAVSQGFPGLQVTSFAASAECERSGRPWHAERPHESCGCSSETALQEKPVELVVAVELPAPRRSGRVSWPAHYDSLFGFHERSKHVRVDMFSKHTSGVIRETE